MKLGIHLGKYTIHSCAENHENPFGSFKMAAILNEEIRLNHVSASAACRPGLFVRNNDNSINTERNFTKFETYITNVIISLCIGFEVDLMNSFSFRTILSFHLKYIG